MKSLRASVLTIAAAGLVWVATPAMADSSDTLSVTVNYDELDLSSTQGAAKLYARLRFAARQVCAPFEGRELTRRAAYKECYNEALANAVKNVNVSAVTALHAAAAHDERAS